MTLLAPYIHFPNTAREAFTFYGEVFETEPAITTAGAMQVPGLDPDLVMHAELNVADALHLYGSDDCDNSGLTPQRVSMGLFGSPEDADQLRTWFARLAEGGTVHVEIKREMWGAEFGQLTDKFGITWMVNIG